MLLALRRVAKLLRLVDQLLAGLADIFAVLELGIEVFGFLDGNRAHQHRLPLLQAFGDLRDDRAVLLVGRAVDLVVGIDAPDRHVGRNLDHVQAVDVHELRRLGHRRTGHAGELAVEAEIILEGDRGERHVLRLDRHALLGFEGLMQPLRIAPSLHHAARELVDDDDLAVLDDVILVELEQLVRPERLIDVMDDDDVVDVVQVAFLQRADAAQELHHVLIAFFSQAHRTLLLVELEIGGNKTRDQRVDLPGRARFIDQDGVHFVDDRVMMAPLRHLLEVVFHVVA